MKDGKKDKTIDTFLIGVFFSNMIVHFCIGFFVIVTGVNMIPIIVGNSSNVVFNYAYAVSIIIASSYFFIVAMTGILPKKKEVQQW